MLDKTIVPASFPVKVSSNTRVLDVNTQKCEWYSHNSPPPPDFATKFTTPSEEEKWSYLGVPAGNPDTEALAETRQRLTQVLAGITALGKSHPAQALQLLRASASACRVEFALQALPPSGVTSTLADECSAQMRQTLASILEVEEVSDDVWKQAALPLRMGGLGLRDPTWICHAARVANLTNAAEKAMGMGTSPHYLAAELDMAITSYLAQVDSPIRPELEPNKQLQAQLTEPLNNAARDALRSLPDPATHARIEALGCAHSTAWTAQSPFVKQTMTATEYRFALRWILGIPLRDLDYVCPDCARPADALGIHAVCCQRTGNISRGHTTLRDTLAEILRRAHCEVLLEQSPAGSKDRPADILVHGLADHPLAIDVTVVTPSRPSAIPSATEPMDQAATAKSERSAELCGRTGWKFRPFVADTYGGLRCDSRHLISSLISRRSGKLDPHAPLQVGGAVWSAVTMAAVSRAGVQLARHHCRDCPLAMPLRALDQSRAPARAAAGNAPPPTTSSTGNNAPHAPSSLFTAGDTTNADPAQRDACQLSGPALPVPPGASVRRPPPDPSGTSPPPPPEDPMLQ